MAKATDLLGKKTEEKNHAGGKTYRRSLEERAVQVLTTNTLNNTYYVTQSELAEETFQIFQEITKKNPEFFANAIIYAREHGFMQFAPTLALVTLSTAQDKSHFKRAFKKVIRTPDNLKEFVAACRSGKLGRILSGTALKAVKEWLQGLSEYHALKYSGSSKDFDLRDIIRLAHPKPGTIALDQRFEWLVKGYKEVENKTKFVETNPQIAAYEALKRNATDEDFVLSAINAGRLPWEVVIPAVGKMTPATWEALSRHMPYMALLRNLNSLGRNDFFKKKENVDYVVSRLTDADAIEKSRILPFRFYDAYQAYGTQPHKVQPVMDALGDALEHSFRNVPNLGGVVAVGTDISGSMNGRINPRGQTTYRDIGAIFSATVFKQSGGSAIMLPFHDKLVPINLLKKDPILTIVDKFNALGSGGTSIGLPIQHLLDNKIHIDTFVGVTDNEDWCYDRWAAYRGRNTYGHQWGEGARGPFYELWQEYRAKVNPNAKAFLITIAPYNTAVAPQEDPNCYFVYGWSPAVVDYVAFMINENLEDLVNKNVT